MNEEDSYSSLDMLFETETMERHKSRLLRKEGKRADCQEVVKQPFRKVEGSLGTMESQPLCHEANTHPVHSLPIQDYGPKAITLGLK